MKFVSANKTYLILHRFSVLDVDEDGVLSLEEMELFYSASEALLGTMNFHVPQMVSWEDLVSQILDMTSDPVSKAEGKFSCMQLKKSCKFPHILNAFINITKFLIDDEIEVVEATNLSPIQTYVMKFWTNWSLFNM